MSSSDSAPLVTLEFEEARRTKWALGLFARRDPANATVFVGDPLGEAFEECLDLVNYLEEAAKQTGRDFHVQIAQARQIAERVQKCWRAANKLKVGASNNGEGGNDCDE